MNGNMDDFMQPLRDNLELPAYTAGNGLLINNTRSELIYSLSTPIHITVMYNTSGVRGVFDKSFTVSPLGSNRFVEHHGRPLDAPKHRHRYFEITIVLKGSIVQEIEGTEYYYPSGYCSLMNRNIVHTERTFEECEVVFLALSDEFARELIEGAASKLFPGSQAHVSNSIFDFMNENISTDKGKCYLDFSPVYQWTHNDTGGDADCTDVPKQRTKSALKLHDIVDRLISSLFLPGLGVDHTVKSLLYELFGYLDNDSAFHMLPVNIKTKNETLLFYRIRQLMSDSDGRITRSQLERSLCYSGPYLNSIVKQHTGMSISEYGMSVSLERAAQLLTGSDKSVSSILELLHFTNQGHFTKHFKEKYGMTPKEYRRCMK